MFTSSYSGIQIPDQYRYMNPQPSKKKHKHKKQHKGQDAERPKEGAQTNSGEVPIRAGLRGIIHHFMSEKKHVC